MYDISKPDGGRLTVDWHLSRCDTNAETVDEATDDEHANVLGSADEDGANDPAEAGGHDGPATAEPIGEDTRDECADERATGCEGRAQ